MSARSKSRKAALDLLFEADIRGTGALEILADRKAAIFADEFPRVRDYTLELITGVSENHRKIDELITTYAMGWDMDRLPAVDRNILRLGIYEILWAANVADAVAIDEALLLAGALSTDESAGFIHGVLARISSIKESLAI